MRWTGRIALALVCLLAMAGSPHASSARATTPTPSPRKPCAFKVSDLCYDGKSVQLTVMSIAAEPGDFAIEPTMCVLDPKEDERLRHGRPRRERKDDGPAEIPLEPLGRGRQTGVIRVDRYLGKLPDDVPPMPVLNTLLTLYVLRGGEDAPGEGLEMALTFTKRVL